MPFLSFSFPDVIKRCWNVRLSSLAWCGPLLLMAACSTTPPPAPAKPVKPSKVAPPPKPRSSTGTSKAPGPKSSPKPSAAQAIRLLRPAAGPAIAQFDGSRNKGIDIAGKPGDPVLAAEAGRVVYAGSELRGYGNLLIIKHSDSLLTAYAHNRKLLVREKDAVRRGQLIAEMGSSDADRVKLHFEVRLSGQAVDPAPFLKAP